MSEDLQHLLEHIRNEGINKARQEAESLTGEAKTKAGEIVEKARAEAEALREKAQAEARDFEERARQSISQAGRDLVITLEQRITRMLGRILDQEVARVMEDGVLLDLVTSAVGALLEDGSEARAEVVLSPERADKLGRHLLDRLRREMDREPVRIEIDERVGAGFSIKLDDGRVEHDFSAPAIAETLAGILRPGLAELLRQDKANGKAE